MLYYFVVFVLIDGQLPLLFRILELPRLTFSELTELISYGGAFWTPFWYLDIGNLPKLIVTHDFNRIILATTFHI